LVDSPVVLDTAQLAFVVSTTATSADSTLDIVVSQENSVPGIRGIEILPVGDVAPSVPSGLSVGVVSESELLVSWNDVFGEDNYELEAGPSGGPYVPVSGSPLAADVTSYPASGLSTGVEVCYVIQATNAFGDSGFSSEVCGIPAALPDVLYRVNAGEDGSIPVADWLSISDNGSFDGGNITVSGSTQSVAQTNPWTTNGSSYVPGDVFDAPEALFDSVLVAVGTGGAITWGFAVTAGVEYEVRLYLGEHNLQDPPRETNLSVEGVLVDSPVVLDTAQLAFVVSTTATSADSTLDIVVSEENSVPGIRGIEILPTASAGPGLLRVVSSPAVPTQVLVDGVPMDSWGLQWVKMPAGSYTVSFTDVQGFSTPADQTVSVVDGATTVVTGSFVERGWLRVSTSPAVPSTISVDGVAMNDFGVWTDVEAGSYEVCYGDVADYTAPGCETVSVSAGATTEVTGTFVSDPGAAGPTGHGYLRVTTSPAVPAQILVDGVAADTWGLNWVKVAPGAHTVSFTDVEGYTTPGDQAVTVIAGDTTLVTGTYLQRGTLQVTTSPAVAGTISVDGMPRDDWGMWTHLPAGSYEVCYGDVAGYVTPGCETVSVTAGALTPATGVFTP